MVTVVFGVVATVYGSFGAMAAPGTTTKPDTDRNDGTLIPTAGFESFVPGGGGGSGPRCAGRSRQSGFGVDAGSNGSVEAPGTREGPNGSEVLYLRICNGVGALVYVPPVDVADVRRRAFDSVVRQVPAPVLNVSPSEGGIIRVQNWLSIDAAPDVVATASVGPVWVTMTARQDSLLWRFGDGGEVACDSPTGSPLPAGVDNVLADDVNGAAECGYTFEHVSAPQFGANDDLAFENSVTSFWAVSWVDYTGAAGALDDLPREADWVFQVRQIQTQRTSGDD